MFWRLWGRRSCSPRPLSRACGGLCCSGLRARVVVTPSRPHTRTEGRWGWVAEMSGRVAGRAHPLEKSAPSFTKVITMGSERLRRHLAGVRFQFAELLDTLDAPHQ
jgi:hypothetical protein